MTKLNEKRIVQLFQEAFHNKKFVSEDVETIIVDGSQFVISTDTLVESTDIPNGMSIENACRKSVVACVSDFAAKGVQPKYGIISLTIPKNYSDKQIKKIARTFGKTSEEFGFKFLGGDTNEGKELVLQVTLIGFTKRIVTRKGAKIGDAIFVTGYFGYSLSGLKIMMSGKKSSNSFEKKAKMQVLSPSVPLNFGISCAKYFSSAMDSSDGLAVTLNEMARQSKKQFIINCLPTNQDVFEFAKINLLDPLHLIFNGGEEYQIVFTTKNRKKIIENSRRYNIPVTEIGYVRKGKSVFYEKQNKKTIIKDVGWMHFKS